MDSETPSFFWGELVQGYKWWDKPVFSCPQFNEGGGHISSCYFDQILTQPFSCRRVIVGYTGQLLNKFLTFLLDHKTMREVRRELGPHYKSSKENWKEGEFYRFLIRVQGEAGSESSHLQWPVTWAIEKLLFYVKRASNWHPALSLAFIRREILLYENVNSRNLKGKCKGKNEINI